MYGCSHKVLLRLWQCMLIAPVTRRSGKRGGGGGGGGGDEYAFSAPWYAFNLCVVCACLVCGAKAVWDDVKAYQAGRSLRMQNTSSAIVTILQISLEFMVCAMAVTCSAARHRALLDIERQLGRVDGTLRASAGQVRAQARYSLLLVAAHAALFAVDGRTWYALSPVGWAYNISYAYLSVGLAAMIMYAHVAWNIGRRFEDVNAAIERKLSRFVVVSESGYRAGHDCFGGGGGGGGGGGDGGHRSLQPREFFPRHVVFVSAVAAAERRIRRRDGLHDFDDDDYNDDDDDKNNVSIAKLQELHWSLCNSIKMVNDKFGWQLFLQLFCNCVQLIVTPYFMIMDLFYPVVYGSTDIKFIMMQVIWVLTHLSHLLLIVMPTSYATTKGEQTAVIICKYMTIDVDPDDLKQFEILVLQSQKYAIDFSACGIVNLHRSTITTIIGTALTYLVILIQFQNTD